jgi:hypothetical protein
MQSPARRSLLQYTELNTAALGFRLQLLSRLEVVAQHADEQEADCDHTTIMCSFAAGRESLGYGFRKRQPRAGLFRQHFLVCPFARRDRVSWIDTDIWPAACVDTDPTSCTQRVAFAGK